MQKVYISGAVRTPVCRSQGKLSGFSEQQLAAMAMQRLIESAGVDPAAIDEIIIGNAKQTSTPSNLARHAQLIARLPVEIPAYTVQRQRASGLQAIINGYLAIASGNAEVIAAGGSESMSQIPLEIRKARFAFGEDTEIIFDPIGNQLKGAQPQERYGALTAAVIDERIAAEYGITDEQAASYQDDSLKKSRLAGKRDHLIPMEVKKKKETLMVTADDGCEPVPAAAVPADGAAMCLLCSGLAASRQNLDIKAEILSVAFASGDPAGGGWIADPVIRQALGKAGCSLDQLDFIEIAESSAVQMMAQRKVLEQMGMTTEAIDKKVNSWGGLLVSGFPWGAAGAVLVTDLIGKLHEENKQYGMVITSAEGGQTLALVIAAK